MFVYVLGKLFWVWFGDEVCLVMFWGCFGGDIFYCRCQISYFFVWIVGRNLNLIIYFVYIYIYIFCKINMYVKLMIWYDYYIIVMIGWIII